MLPLGVEKWHGVVAADGPLQASCAAWARPGADAAGPAASTSASVTQASSASTAAAVILARLAAGIRIVNSLVPGADGPRRPRRSCGVRRARRRREARRGYGAMTVNVPRSNAPAPVTGHSSVKPSLPLPAVERPSSDSSTFGAPTPAEMSL